jgi:outer membrane protein TolC
MIRVKYGDYVAMAYPLTTRVIGGCIAALIAIHFGGLAAAEDSDSSGSTAVAKEVGESHEPVPVPLSLSLEDAQRIALENNPSLMAAAARVRQARARVKQARSLYFPQIDASYVASHTHLSNNTVRAAKDQALNAPVGAAIGQAVPQAIVSGFPVGSLQAIGQSTLAGLYSGWQARIGFDEEVEQYSATLQASLIIFDGFSRHHTNAMARFGRRETEAARREVYRLILDAVAQSYYGVQLARENVAIAEADEAFNERLLKEARLRRERGTGSKSDVLNFEVLVRAAKSSRIRAESERDVARVALAALMGLPEARLGKEVVIAPLPDETAQELSVPDIDEHIDAANVARPDLQQSEWIVARLRAQLGQRKSVYYPQVNAFASQDAQRAENGRIEEDDFSHTVGLSLSYSLFAGGRNRANVAEARHQLEEAQFILEETRLAVASDVRQGGINLRAAQDTLVLQRTTAEYVNTNRDLVEKEYRAGQGTLARLNQAQRDLIAAEARLALARVAVYSAGHSLRTVTGETISRFEGYIDGGDVVSDQLSAGEVD